MMATKRNEKKKESISECNMMIWLGLEIFFNLSLITKTFIKQKLKLKYYSIKPLLYIYMI